MRTRIEALRAAAGPRETKDLESINTGRFFFIFSTTELLVGLPTRAIRSKRIAATGILLKLKNEVFHRGPVQKQLETGHKTPGIAILGGAGMGQSPGIGRSCRVIFLVFFPYP